MAAFLGMGTSDDFVYENIRLEDIFAESSLNWIDDISLSAIQSLAKTVISMPLVVLLLASFMLLAVLLLILGWVGYEHVL